MTPDKTIIACTRPASRSNTLLERGPPGAWRGVVGGAVSPPGTAEQDSSPPRAPSHGLFLSAAPGDPVCSSVPQPLSRCCCVWRHLRRAPGCVPALRCMGTRGVFPGNCCLICRAIACGSPEASQTPSVAAGRDWVLGHTEWMAEPEDELRFIH